MYLLVEIQENSLVWIAAYSYIATDSEAATLSTEMLSVIIS